MTHTDAEFLKMFKKSAEERLKLDGKYEQMYYIITFFMLVKVHLLAKTTHYKKNVSYFL